MYFMVNRTGDHVHSDVVIDLGWGNGRNDVRKGGSEDVEAETV